MGILDFLFGGNKELKNLREEVAKGLLGLKQDIQQRNSATEKETGQILNVLESLESEIHILKEDAKNAKRTAISEERLQRRMACLEKLADSLKTAGKLSLQNYDAIKSMEFSLKKLDAIERALKEHIAKAPEVIISKDEYAEEISELKKRLDALESKELIILRQPRKKQKRS